MTKRRTIRRRAPRVLRRRFKRRRISKKGIVKTRFGRKRIIGRNISSTQTPLASTILVWRNAKPMPLNVYANATSNNQVNSFVIRANDIVHPVEKAISCYGSDRSVRGMLDLAERYSKHRVDAFKLDMSLVVNHLYNEFSGHSNATAADGPSGPRTVYVAWRLVDKCPLDYNPVTSKNCFNHIVNNAGVGWRWKRILTDSVKQKTVRISTGWIPTRKFYHHPYMSNDLEVENDTSDMTAVAGIYQWTGPTDKTFVQVVVFASDQTQFATELSGAPQFNISIQANVQASYKITSYERLPKAAVVLNQYTSCVDPAETLALMVHPDEKTNTVDEVFTETVD